MIAPWLAVTVYVSALGAQLTLARWRLAQRAVPLRVTPLGVMVAFAGVVSLTVAIVVRGVTPLEPVCCAALSVAAITDASSGYVLDVTSIVSTLAIVTLAAFEGRFESALLGACACTAVMGVIYMASARRGLGLGDVKLAAAIGAGFGWLCGIIALAAGFVLGAVVGVLALAMRGADRRSIIPFAPALALGVFVALCWSAYRG